MSESQVKNFYKRKNIFITGVTGFLGKALLEKLLRSCDVGKIYVLIRSKRGKNVDERLEELKKNLVFERLKKEKGEDVLNRLTAVGGDVSEEGLGLSEKDKKTLIENVNLVFHSAATLDFDQNIKVVVNINLLGTRRTIQLCSEMNNLEAFVYVSTAYVNSNRTTADEILYPITGNVEELLSVYDMSDEDAEKETQRIIKDHPNSYTISKAFAEHEVARFNSKVPCAIVRPSMIIGAWREPSPGWTESKNGFPGFVMGAAMGVVRRLPVNKDLVYDYITVDMVVNELILAGWHAATNRQDSIAVFHCTSSTQNPFSWNKMENKINDFLSMFPLKNAVWYPTIKLLPSFTLFRISSLIFHFLPGFFFDLLLRVSGKRAMLLKIHWKVDRSLSKLAPFIFKEWYFDNSNTRKLFSSLGEFDRETFNIDISDLDYQELFETGVLGVRRYLNKEELSTIPAGRRKHRMLYVLNLLVQALFFSMLWWLSTLIFDYSITSVVFILPVIYLIHTLL